MKGLRRIKIGKGYFQSGYGRGFKKSPIIYLINGKAYAKDKGGADSELTPLKDELCGYVAVNIETIYGNFHQVSALSSEHKEYKAQK